MKIFLFLCLLIISLQQGDIWKILACFGEDETLRTFIEKALVLYATSNKEELLKLILANFTDVKGTIKNCLKE